MQLKSFTNFPFFIAKLSLSSAIFGVEYLVFNTEPPEMSLGDVLVRPPTMSSIYHLWTESRFALASQLWYLFFIQVRAQHTQQSIQLWDSNYKGLSIVALSSIISYKIGSEVKERCISHIKLYIRLSHSLSHSIWCFYIII